MRISLLEKRENFYKILKETLITSYLYTIKNKDDKNFVVNKYLNFIAAPELPNSVFQILINEYSSSLIWWKKIIQSIYVKLAISSLFRSFFAQKTIQIPTFFDEYLILGGNHRLRLFSKDLISSIVLLKKGERNNFLINDVEIRTKNNLFYAPKIISHGKDWFEEEYFEGTPINRLTDKTKVDFFILKVIENHVDELLNKTVVIVKLDTYKKKLLDEITNIISVENDNKKIVYKIYQTIELLFLKLENKDINMSWTHGDFQQANILIKNNDYKVIDWESSSERFKLYDIFVLLSEIRTGVSLVEAFNFFKNKVNTYKQIDAIYENDIILLLVEELRFSVNEDFSQNFYHSGKKTNVLCDSILKYVNV
jgi:thiamine kinase-like enzyme